ncbi:chromatin accessibility complex protein 1 isoform X2 [Physeter macrocephalus]|uniref:Chromatin accessibility complex protein 1 isoform X2 n=1 Tax=Physeter macrocephalus TaxID=9755 RepID=A0A9W2X6P6_PHYMC|nr:chromatin accessibility complex protein 1 isoform X2 [Physeter catodon]
MADVVMGKEKCGEQRLVSLPLSRIRVIMKSSPEVSSINQEALVLTAKATSYRTPGPKASAFVASGLFRGFGPQLLKRFIERAGGSLRRPDLPALTLGQVSAAESRLTSLRVCFPGRLVR